MSAAALLLGLGLGLGTDGGTPTGCSVGPDAQWQVVDGKMQTNYYRLGQEDGRTTLHADYPAGAKTVTLGRRLKDGSCNGNTLAWSWRVHRFPTGSDERLSAKADSAVAVYATFGSMLHRQSLKYVWSSVLPTGTVVGRKKSMLFDVVTLVLEGPGPVDVWKRETVNAAADWARYFGNGKTTAQAPPLVALGVLTDGDQTHTTPSADYADFTLAP